VLPQVLYRRAIFVYLAVIVVPALVLLYLGLQSVKRQNEAISALQASNLRLSQERLAAELERRSALVAETCLREAAAVARDHARLEEVRRRHPVARHFFVLEDDAVRRPLLRTPPPRLPDGLPAEFHQAEAAELREDRPAEALAAYQRVLEMEASDSVKALALSRVARCLQKLRRSDEAAQTWRTLLEKYGDLRDPSHRPYALVAGFELGQERQVYEDIVQGRWELSAGQVGYFLERLEGPVPDSHADLLSRFEFAQALEESFRHVGPIRQDEVYRLALPPYQLYYLLLSPGTNPETLLGLSVDSAWVEKELVPQIRSELGIAEQAPTSGGRSLLLYGGATGLVLGVLLMGVVLLIRDVTREMRVNQLRAEFVSGVSHELRTPLTLIRLYGDTLLEGGDFAEEERRGFYRIITRESERLTHLIEKVLTFSRIERGEKQYRLEEGDLAPVVARTVEPYEQYLPRRGFTVETKLAAELPPVRFDPDGVSQAVVNLLDNAEKYSGGSKFVGIRLHPADGSVVFEVEDHGIGIPPEQQDRIFQRFYRLSNAEAKGGYGLGLFLVRHIMEAHGGKVELESEPGRGSRFRLVFPVVS